ncbi:MAG: YggS family pyridoxal phosphate-dependent enzyme [Bryobacteraceae bacterium]|nr:YggS family pyridoxal phosphate-dependent enzyme [Bryobacteraceae bacterium]
MLQDCLNEVEDRIARACSRSGRSRDEVTLIAVTKVFPASAILEAYELGLRDFGENYVQEFSDKFPEVSHLDGARFHLIGHLQSNKSTRATEIFRVIQTVDTPRLARRLAEAGHPVDIMLEVKLAPEEAKFGVEPDALPELIDAVRQFPSLRVLGLMTIPPWSDDQELSRPYFSKLGELAALHGMRCLSMGMSNDFEAAIEEGSTHIRVGTALFGPRIKK